MRFDSIVRVASTSLVLRENPLGDPMERTTAVYLPPAYNDEPNRYYPVIWVLAPFTSWGERYFSLQAWDENIPQRMDRLISTGQAEPAILIFPDCFTRLGGSQYVNSSAVGDYEDYIIDDLIPKVEGQFRTLNDRDHRGVMGYSSGGYGALVLSMRHSDTFGAAACHSGDMGFEWCYLPDIPGAVRAIEQAGGLDALLNNIRALTRPRDKSRDFFAALNLVAMSACYSPNPGSPFGFDLPFDSYSGEIIPDVWQRWLEGDPIRMAAGHVPALRDLTALYFDCGLRDEYNLFLGARQFHRKLTELEIAHQYEEHDGGHHHINWRYDQSLPLITRALSANT
nr:esterase [Anaerolineae bacterium]